MGTHVEMFNDYRAAADRLDNFRTELNARRESHKALWLKLTAGVIDFTTATTTEAADNLLAGRLPGTRSDALLEMQAQELTLRNQIAAMGPLENRLAEQAELARVKARESVIRDDPRTAAIQKRWDAARAAVQAALDLEAEQRADVVAGAFGAPELPRPEGVNTEALH